MNFFRRIFTRKNTSKKKTVILSFPKKTMPEEGVIEESNEAVLIAISDIIQQGFLSKENVRTHVHTGNVKKQATYIKLDDNSIITFDALPKIKNCSVCGRWVQEILVCRQTKRNICKQCTIYRDGIPYSRRGYFLTLLKEFWAAP
jgi:hypothetical protein